MLCIFQVVSGAAWAVYRLMQDTPVWYTSNLDHNHRCVYFLQPCYRAILISYDLKKLVSVSARYLLFQPMDEKKRSKHGLFVFSSKKTLIWGRHCSISQSCFSMTSRRTTAGWFLKSSRTWSFFTPSIRWTNQNSLAYARFYLFDKEIIVRLICCLFVLFACSHLEVVQKSL